MEKTELTKVCTKCGKELPLSEFYKHPNCKNGVMNKCKDCHNADIRKNKQAKKMSEAADKSHTLHKVYFNPELAKFQPKDLIAELRARGYSGELSIRQTIVV